MRTLIEGALQFRVIVVVLAVLLVIAGLRAAQRAPQDVFPEFAPPKVEIQTEGPGLSTVEIEELVTTPLEQALAGLPWVDEVESKSVLGLSSVVLHLDRSADLLEARQLVQERVAAAAARLPPSVRAPAILPPLSTTSRLMKIGLKSETLSVVALTDAALWTVRPRLMAIPGVANVAVWGARREQIQVRVDPEALGVVQVSVAEVQRAAADATSTRSGGYVDTPNQRLAVVHRPSVRDAADLADSPVTTVDGRTLRLGDVAEVVSSWPQPIGDAVIDGGDGLLLIVEKQPWGNTLQVTHAVEAALEELAPALKGVVVDPTIFRPATFIERALENLRHTMGIGVILVIVVLLAFEGDWRSAAISATAIPLSILTAVLALTAWGLTFNTMILAGLVIAVGEVVDDAIIDVENISKRLREQGPEGPSALSVVVEASLEVRSAVVFASAIVVLIFVPVLFLDGVSGAFFRPLALAYVVAIGASLGVALTVTPALCLWALPGRSARAREPRLVAGLKALYRPILGGAVRWPRLTLASMGVCLALTAATLPFLGESFLPEFRETDLLMHWVEKPGTSLTAMRRITSRVGDELLTVPGVRNFGAHIGRAEQADEVVGPNFTELWISLDEEADHDETIAKVQAVIDGYPGLYRDVLTYLKERIKEVLSGSGASLVVRVTGPDVSELQRLGREVARELSTVAGVVDPRVETQATVPQIEIGLRPEAGRLYGIGAGGLREAVASMLAETPVGSVYDGPRVVEVAVVGPERLRQSPEGLRSLLVPTPSGMVARLSDLAEVRVVSSPNVIVHNGGFRRIDVLAGARDGDLGRAARGVEEALAKMSFPLGYHAEVLGEYRERQAATQRLGWTTLASLLAIFLVLHADFGSLRLAGLVYVSLPFALIGGVIAVVLTGGVMSLGSVVGFVTVLGIAARNGILLISHYRQLEAEGAAEVVIRGALERLSPILMTASCAGLSLLPIVVAGPVAGHEIEQPMAVVILGGLATSTALNLLVIPALYGWLQAGRRPTAGP